MLYLYYGDDSFSLQQSLASLKGTVEPEELREVNVSVLDGARSRFEELAAVCDTVPFMSQKRMVIVEGLLSRFERRGVVRGAEAAEEGREHAAAGWDSLTDYVGRMPETTDLVLVDGRLSEPNPLLRKLRTRGQVHTFPLPKEAELRQWIRRSADAKGVQIEPRAVEALADTVGGDLRSLDSELEKLSLYCHGRAVRRQDVEALVTYAREVSIFAAVDAVVEGKPQEALRLVRRILDGGVTPARLLSLLARQVRLLVLAKDHIANGVPRAELGGRLRLKGYPLSKTLAQEPMFTERELVQMHHRLLEADLSVKTGASEEEEALDLLIAELAMGASRRRPAARRTQRI